MPTPNNASPISRLGGFRMLKVAVHVQFERLGEVLSTNSGIMEWILSACSSTFRGYQYMASRRALTLNPSKTRQLFSPNQSLTAAAHNSLQKLDFGSSQWHLRFRPAPPLYQRAVSHYAHQPNHCVLRARTCERRLRMAMQFYVPGGSDTFIRLAHPQSPDVADPRRRDIWVGKLDKEHNGPIMALEASYRAGDRQHRRGQAQGQR